MRYPLPTRHVLARDWIASGIIGLGTASALPFFISLGAHALLGVAGGGAIISGVLWVLSGLTLPGTMPGAPRRSRKLEARPFYSA